jgi:hypothetical protein
MAKNNNKKMKTTKHTIEFSNNTLAYFCPIPGNPASLIQFWQRSQAPVFGHPVRRPRRSGSAYSTLSISAPKNARFSTNNG